MDLTEYDLPQETIEVLQPLLAQSQRQPPELEDILIMIDRVWDEIGCDNQNLDDAKLAQFYQHPVWLLNGLFIETHEQSLQHRYAIAQWIMQHDLRQILDFGGGFGTLACILSDQYEGATIDIYEPFPNALAVARAELYGNIHFVDSLASTYDCMVSMDVLEHVPDPLGLLAEMIAAVRPGGYLLIATCFYPAIKCHLPSTFHLRYTFDQFTMAMGLETIGHCIGSHALIYRKVKAGEMNWPLIRQMEEWSRQLFSSALLAFQDMGVQA